MMKPVFHIKLAEVNNELANDSTLLIELSENALSFVVIGKNNFLSSAAYFVLPDQDEHGRAHAVRDIIYGEELLQLDFQKCIVVYNLFEALLIPDEYYRPELQDSYASVFFGNLKKNRLYAEKQGEVHTLYRIPPSVQNLLEQKFKGGSYWHIYSLWQVALHPDSAETGSGVHLVFASGKVLTAIMKDGQLLLMQSFHYATPEDVAYQLLKCCQELAIAPEECKVSVGGFIDEDSALFTELKKYFLHIGFDKLLDSDEPMLGDYPAHYFSYLQKLSTCVS